jgi:outer membrane immunogenic protein
MKKFLLASVAIGALIAGPAMAADIAARPVYRRPVAVAVPYSWTGFYVGVNGGYGWGAGTRTLDSTITSDFPEPADSVTTAGQQTLDPHGGFGGGQIGYNWQGGSWVYGLEADFQGANIKANNSLNLLNTNEPADDAMALSQASSKLSAFGSFRGRIGFLATPSWLFYGTGGLAFGRVKDAVSVVACDCTDPDPTERFGSTGALESSTWKWGYAVGGGMEWLVAPSWSVKAEYLYIDLRSNVLAVTSDNRGDHAVATTKFDHRYNTFRVGLNYHFGYAAAPAVYK